jgi:omega-amidase
MSALLNVSLLQADLIWEASDANRAYFTEQIERLPENTHLVVLPEMFTTGFSMRSAELAEPAEGPTLAWCQTQAQANKVAITGSWIVEEAGHYFNRMHFVWPNGQYAKYDKRHLFRMAGEDTAYTAGKEQVIVDFLGWRISLQVCYDLRFPVWARNPIAEGRGYDLQIYVANWPSVRIQHWRTLLMARAIENQAYVIGVNRVGTDASGNLYDGHSMVVDFQGQLLAEAPNEVQTLSATLDASSMMAWRARFPVWQDADSFRLG